MVSTTAMIEELSIVATTSPPPGASLSPFPRRNNGRPFGPSVCLFPAAPPLRGSSHQVCGVVGGTRASARVGQHDDCCRAYDYCTLWRVPLDVFLFSSSAPRDDGWRRTYRATSQPKTGSEVVQAAASLDRVLGSGKGTNLGDHDKAGRLRAGCRQEDKHLLQQY